MQDLRSPGRVGAHISRDWRGGMGCGVGGHRSHHGGHSEGHGDGHSDGAPRLESAIDAVSGQAVGVEKALTSVYRGRTYYFATRENRDTFEAAPERDRKSTR